MDLSLTNTWSKKKELFKPIKPGQVGMYSCGPTVYSFAHLGNLRSYVFPDVLKKLLRYLGYEVNHVINITDVGHLTSNADEGEDKIEKAAKSEHKSAWEIAAFYTQAYLDDLDRLNIEHPTKLAKATEHLPEMIALVKKLEEKGFTYLTTDGIYFDTSKFPDYGEMSNLNKSELLEGARVEVNEEKKNPSDFALWKFSPSPPAGGEKRQMEWESPWGVGFPGWHIECSAMSMKYLGNHFDIHTGGQDHISTHHPNEIAQSEAATGEKFVNYWLHGYFLTFDKEVRMGKSEGNALLLLDLTARGFSPVHYRYFVLGAHYRSYLSFSWEALEGAKKSYESLMRKIQSISFDKSTGQKGASEKYREGFFKALTDDLNTPLALGELWKLVKDKTVPSSEALELIEEADKILSLSLVSSEGSTTTSYSIPANVKDLAERRLELKKRGDYVLSDRLRDEIKTLGFEIKDEKAGYKIEKITN
ncbi:MAG: cysteine--tRNA ligase [bacterium]|nr:cysteine--tRNA ligase [bacterium]